MPYLAPGFSDNQQLDDLYYQDVDRYNKLTPTQFVEIVRTRVYRTRWHLDVQRGIETFQQGNHPFIELFEKMTGQNQLLEGNQEHLKDLQLMLMMNERGFAGPFCRIEVGDVQAVHAYRGWQG